MVGVESNHVHMSGIKIDVAYRHPGSDIARIIRLYSLLRSLFEPTQFTYSFESDNIATLLQLFQKENNFQRSPNYINRRSVNRGVGYGLERTKV